METRTTTLERNAKASSVILPIHTGSPVPAKMPEESGFALSDLPQESANKKLSNHLLENLAEADQRLLRPHMQTVSLPHARYIYHSGETPVFAHFITSGLASVVATMDNTKTAEVGVWGNEGIVEQFHLLGTAPLNTDCIMQIEGTALRMPFSILQEAFDESTTLQKAILQSVQIKSSTQAQIAACNRLHGSTERLARLLLMVHDSVGGDNFTLTQEFISEMLGSRRSTVTVSAGLLQEDGMIEYRRGRIRILDRSKLECAACECYRSVRTLQNSRFI